MSENMEVNEPVELSPATKERLKKFDPTKPLIISATEISGFAHLGGRFVFKRPTLGDQLAIGVQSAKLRENLELDAASDSLAYIIATFNVVCKEKPKECVSFDALYDFDPIFELYGRYMEWIGFFRLTVQERQERASST